MRRYFISLSLIVFSTILVSHLSARQIVFPLTVAGIVTENRSSIEDYFPACDTPLTQPRYIAIGAVTATSVSGGIEGTADADGYLVVISTNSKPGFIPAAGTNYTIGSTVGNGTVVKAGTGISFSATGLSANTSYYVYVFSMRSSCPGGTVYRSYNPTAVMARTAAAGSGN